MPESSVDPDNATANWLPNLSAALNACISLLSGPIEVFFSGISKNGRPANGKRSRRSVSRVKAIVAATLHTPAHGPGGLPAEAAARRQAAAGFHIAGDADAAGTGVRRQVRIDFGRRPGPGAGPVPPAFPYTASVHEFGHVFGFPDEYMDYTYPLKNCLVVARSQGRIDQLAALFNVPSFAWPVGDTENMNPNLMSLGTVFHERYYLTFFEALSKLLFLGAANPPVYKGPAARNHDIAHFPFPEDPAFNPIANLLRTAADAFEAAAGPPLETRADLRARIVAGCAVVPVAQNLLYLNDLDSDAVVLALATGRNLRRHFIQTGIVVQNECLHCAIQVEALKPIINLVISITGVLLNSVPFPLAGAPRIKVTLRAVRAFAGIGRINFNPPGIVTAHTAAAAGALVNPGLVGTVLPGTAVLGALAHANGKDVWLEGVAQGVTDMTLELYNAAGLLIAQTEPVRILCGPPVEVLIDRKPIGTDVAMPLQGCANSTFPFTEIRLRKIAPGITGLNLCRVAKAAAGGADFTLHAARNGAALVMPYDVPDANYDNNEETSLYLAGTVRSAAAGDRSLTFAAGAGAVFTIVLVTVVDIVNLEVLLTDSTPVTARTVGMTVAAVPRTTSGGAQLPNAAVLRTYRPHLASHGFADFGRPAPGALIAARRANYGSEDFAVNSPLVLIERSIPAPGANIRATVHPQGIAAHWYVERNDDDNDRLASLGAALPALIPLAPAIAGPDLVFTAQVEPNSVGSFHLRLSLNNDRDDILTFNVVIVRAIALNLDASRANVPRRHHVMEKKLTAPNAAAGVQHIHVSSGDWPPGGAINQPAESGFACVLRGDVHLIGGGADGLLGQDCVFAGWIQNLVQFTVQADYTDSAAPGHIRTLAMQVGGNQEEGALRTNNDRYFVNGGAALARLQPLVANGSEIMLDTGRSTAGGSSILLSNSAADAPVADDTIGWRMRASAADSPGTEFFLRHPSRATAFLTSMEYIHIFRSFLSVWTDGTAPALASINGGHALHGAGNRIFTCCGDLRWRVNGAWRVNVNPGAWRGAGAGATPVLANYVLVHRVRDISVTIHQPFVPFPAALPASNLAETKLPTMVAAFSWNAIW